MNALIVSSVDNKAPSFVSQCSQYKLLFDKYKINLLVISY